MSNKQKQIDPLPEEFASYEEAAEFWDLTEQAQKPGIAVSQLVSELLKENIRPAA